MTTKEYLFLCLMEECNEVSQITSKSLRFGLDEVYRTQPLTNRERLMVEFADLIAVYKVLVEEGLLPDFDTLDFWINVNSKKAKIEKYLQYSKDLGIVDGC